MSTADLDLHTLVLKAQLASVFYFEISGRRNEDEASVDAESKSDEAANVSQGDNSEGRSTSVQHLQTARRDDDAAFRVRIRLDITTPSGDIVVDISAEYELSEIGASSISEDLLLEYVNEVGIMQLIPYIRQSVADISQRVFGEPLLLPVLQRGEMVFSRDDDA